MSKINPFPICTNKVMDDLAASLGLNHWSCLSPRSNRFWIRIDGYEHDADASWVEELKFIDKLRPLEEDSK